MTQREAYLYQKEGGNPLYPTVFASKLWDIAEEKETEDIVGWDESGTAFVIRKAHLFMETVLPKYFQHQNMCSFIRQLNLYGFSKTTETTSLEFKHSHFVKGKKDDIRFIRRRKTDKRNSNQDNADTYEYSVDIGQKCSKQDNDRLTGLPENLGLDASGENITSNLNHVIPADEPSLLNAHFMSSPGLSLSNPDISSHIDIIQQITREICDTKDVLSLLRSEVYLSQTLQEKTKDGMHFLFQEVQRFKHGFERRISDVSYNSTSLKGHQAEELNSPSAIDLNSNTATLSDHSERDSPGFSFPSNSFPEKTHILGDPPESVFDSRTEPTDIIEPFQGFGYFE